MVKIREGLPLIDGQTSEEDSASFLTAQLANHPAMSTDALPNYSSYSHNNAQRCYQDFDNNFNQPIYHTLNNHHSDHIDIPAWLAKVAKRIDKEQTDKLTLAVKIIQQINLDHQGTRSNIFVTGIGMTDILTYLYQDEDALVSAMLYRAVRHDFLNLEEIEATFGKNIRTLVFDTLAMGRLSDSIEKNKRLEDNFATSRREQLTHIYNMLISVTNDVRVVLIKLVERTFAMRELTFCTQERQQRVAHEVMNIYAPLAHRLGIAQIKWELEDLSFRYLAAERYKQIAKLLAEKRSERENYIEMVQNQLKDALSEADIEAQVSGRVKHIYSIYRKMQSKNLSFDQLYDIRALRILVKNKAECYHVLGIVHGLWRHIPDQFDDYITNPKTNGYRSLHTAVIAEYQSLEIQIRTEQMHFEAELGMCSHVNYKEGGKSDTYLNQHISSLRQILSTHSEIQIRRKSSQSSRRSVNNDKQSAVANRSDRGHNSQRDSEEDQIIDFEEFKRIYVFSRDGEIIQLPKGATVLDYAYYIHTQVGNQAQAGRVNKRYVPLTYQLNTGEQVEIITKASREPNRDWLVPSMGYIQTNRARGKLRQWFNRLDRDKNIEVGRELLDKELQRLSMQSNKINLSQYVDYFKVKNTDDILIGLVSGEIGIYQLTKKISNDVQLNSEEPLTEFKPSIHPKATGKLDAYKICIDGLDNIEINLANCCNPVRGEPIAGFITQGKGVRIHHRGCMEYARLIEREPERQIEATWYAEEGNRQPVAIYIEAYDRRGLLKDLTQVLDLANVNIRQVSTISTLDDIAKLKLHIEVSGLEQLSRILAKLEQQAGILTAKRSVGS